MNNITIKTSHEDLFLSPGHLMLMQFMEGFVPLRVTGMTWSSLEPWALGPVAALGNLALYNDLVDAQQRRQLEPYNELIIYQTFWGVTPSNARIYMQYPPRTDIGSMLNVPRTITGDIGYVNGHRSPFSGPFSRVTEVITVKEKYPQFQAYNPTNDAMANVMLNFDQRQFTYMLIKDKALIKDMVLGRVNRKIYTVGTAFPLAAAIPDYMRKAITQEILDYTQDFVMGRVA
jgi:hypothetical protein